MIESVSTSPVQSSALRSAPQSTNAAPVSAPSSSANFISSRVVVDNLQNVAILQYRSSDGNVVQQYPTEAQIQAFKRAERLASEHVENARLEQPVAPASSGGGQTSAPVSAPSAPVNSTPAPSTSDIVQAAASYSPPAAPGGNSTQSVTA
jgi:hypothetical protein